MSKFKFSLSNIYIFSLREYQEISATNPKHLPELIYEYSKNTVDAQYMPFLQSLTACEDFVPMLIAGEWGECQQELNLFLFHQEQLIGVIFFTLWQNETCYIPDIGVIPAYQGQGLGKILLTNGLEHVLRHRPTTQAFELDVSLSNKALRLYESLGFITTVTYEMVFRNRTKDYCV